MRVSFAAHDALPFRIEVFSSQGARSYRGATADAAADAALSEVEGRAAVSLVALAIEPGGEGPVVDALREWIEHVTPLAPEPVRPALRLVR